MEASERELLHRLAAGPVSGDVLARELGLTRAAIWKRVQALREAGIGIEAQAGRGYALQRQPEWLDADVILGHLENQARRELSLLEVAWAPDSTNSRLLQEPAPEAGARVLLAERQTAGRGRRGRAWVSPLAAHVYLSVLRQYCGGLSRLGGLSLVAGVASAEALHAAGFGDVRLKWPNDLVVEGHKLGGILVEGGGEHGGPARAVVGLGINVRMPVAQAGGIDQPWIDLHALAQDKGITISRNRLAAGLLSKLLPAFELFDREGLQPFVSRYAAMDALQGQQVDVRWGNEVFTGIAEGIAADGALQVRDGNGVRPFHAGEVSVRAS